MKKPARYALDAGSAVSGEGLILADGSIWSHAATLGTRTKGDQFTIGADQVKNAVKVFTQGYPRKVPVDYNHSSTTNDPEIRKLRAEGRTPKAGDVLELKAVLSVADFEGELKSTAEKLAAQTGRKLEDSRNLGLWMRWKPTARALQAIKAGEYTELSIAFDEDIPNNVDGAGQGFGLWAVALLNTPFLDDMLPVAASRDTDPPPAGEPASREVSMKHLGLITALAAVHAATVTTEDEAGAVLPQLLPKVKADREFSAAVAKELGISDPSKAVEKIKELSTQVAEFKAAAEKAAKDAIEATAESTVKQYESKIGNAGLRKMIKAQLVGELTAGKKLEETESLATLKSMGKATNLGQTAAGDNGAGNASSSDEEKIVVRAKELMSSNAEIKELITTKGRSAALEAAIEMAERELTAGATA